MELWERIAQARKAAGLSQEELGNRLGVSRQAVSKWETNQTKPDVDTVVRMCQVLDLSADYLLFGKEDAVPVQASPAQDAPAGELDEQALGRKQYAILLLKPVQTVFAAAQYLLMDSRGCSADVARAMLENAPTVLLRDLDLESAREALTTLRGCGYSVAAIDTEHSATVEEAMDAPRISLLLEKDPTVPKEPMSFGMTVLAVMAGIVGALLLMMLF